jgi:hypothetical protein
MLNLDTASARTLQRIIHDACGTEEWISASAYVKRLGDATSLSQPWKSHAHLFNELKMLAIVPIRFHISGTPAATCEHAIRIKALWQELYAIIAAYFPDIYP